MDRTVFERLIEWTVGGSHLAASAEIKLLEETAAGIEQEVMTVRAALDESMASFITCDATRTQTAHANTTRTHRTRSTHARSTHALHALRTLYTLYTFLRTLYARSTHARTHTSCTS